VNESKSVRKIQRKVKVVMFWRLFLCEAHARYVSMLAIEVDIESSFLIHVFLKLGWILYTILDRKETI
jgi:hypothetical protein